MLYQTFQSGMLPDKLKIAKAIIRFKKDDWLPADFQWSSKILTFYFSKIFERAMYQRLFKFLEFHEILYNLQFGFQENNSIGHALISLTETIRHSIDNRYGCVMFIDLQKAFDTVNHQILLSKMEHYGVRRCALEWFKSYLSDRKQYVSLNGFNSGFLKISCGVPQESVLAPLVFLLYINGLLKA